MVIPVGSMNEPTCEAESDRLIQTLGIQREVGKALNVWQTSICLTQLYAIDANLHHACAASETWLMQSQ